MQQVNIEQLKLSYLVQIIVKIVVFIFLPTILLINLVGDFILMTVYFRLPGVDHGNEFSVLIVPLYVFLFSVVMALLSSGFSYFLVRSLHASQSKFFFLEVINNLEIEDKSQFITDLKKRYADESVGYIAELVFSYFNEAKKQERLKSELLIAQEVQDNFLLKDFSAFDNTHGKVDLYADLISARYVGGDFYDAFFLDEEHVLFTIGDAAGKGIPACLFTARAISAIRLQAQLRFVDLKAKYEDFFQRLSPARLLSMLNTVLSQNNPSATFITVGVGVLNITNGEVRYANAGHEWPYLITSEGVKLLEIDAPSRPVGLRKDSIYHDQVFQLSPGDSLLLYTDGIIEALNKESQPYGQTSLVASLEGGYDCRAKKVVEQVVTNLQSFVHSKESKDDIALLCISWLNRVENKDVLDADRLILDLTREHIKLAKDHLIQFCNKNYLIESIQHDLTLCLEEYLLNLMTHAQPEKVVEKVNIDILLTKSMLKILITDPFSPYDITQIDYQDLSQQYQLQGKEGGRGIKLMMNLADATEYYSKKGWNTLVLIKYLRGRP